MNIDTIKKTSRTKYLHSLAKLSAKENHESQLLLTQYGGTFRVTPQLISFLSTGHLGAKTIILDIFETPIEVDRVCMLHMCIDLYNMVMRSWLETTNEINSKR